MLLVMIANPSPKTKYLIPQGCSGYDCKKCIFRHIRNKNKGCQLSTFMPVETSRVYDEHSRTTHKVAKRPSTRYNRDITI